jgi:uncharacterized membrane protein YhaH (DUF805 family)
MDTTGSSSSSGNGIVTILFLLLIIALLWFTWAQGAKRCHDLGNSGWQLIPFYALWLLFADGQSGINRYGDNPKGIGNNLFSFEEPEENTPSS